MKGKEKCGFLRKLRREIAEQNGIELQTEECSYQGDCSGTCPKCEEELRVLENAVDERQKNGFDIHLAGIAAGSVEEQGELIPDWSDSPQWDGEVMLAGIPAADFDLVGLKVSFRDGGGWEARYCDISPYKDAVIGRSPDCDVMIDCPYLSARHLLLTTDGDDIFIRDLDSTNQTYVNGDLLQGTRTLTGGDIVSVYTLELQIERSFR